MNTLVLRNYPCVIRGLKTDCWTLSSRFLGNTEQTSCELTAQGWSGSLAWRSPAHIPSRRVWTHAAPPSTCAHPVTRMDARGTSEHPVPTCVDTRGTDGPLWSWRPYNPSFPPLCPGNLGSLDGAGPAAGFPCDSHSDAVLSLPFCWQGDRGGWFFYKLVGLFEISLSSGVSIHRLYFRRKMIHLIQVFILNRVAT